jgi:amino acid transporter
MSKGKEKTVFAREATGLVREIGWFTAVALVMSAVIGAGINVFAVQAFGYTSANNVSPLAMVLLAAVPFFCSAYCLGVMSSAMPRSGGPYVIISRAVTPAAGYLATWGSWVSIAFSVGLLADADIYVWGASFTVYGAISGNAGLVALGTALGTAVPEIVGGIIITLIITIIAALGVNIWGRVVQILFIIPVIGSIFTFGALLSHTAADLPAFWNAVFPGTYNEILANGASYAPTFAGSIAALPGVIFAYTAFYASSYVGGEVKNPKRNMVLSTVVGMLLIILFFVGYTGGLARAVGEQFLYGYAQLNGPGGIAFGQGVTGAPAILPLFAAIYTYSVPLLSFFVAVTGALWLLNDLPPFYLIATRSTFAWAFDRQFPEKFSEVNERFHSPVWSVVLCAVLALPMCVLFAVTPIYSLWYTTTIDLFTYLFICVAGLFFIKKFKAQYDKGMKLGGRGTLYFFAVVGIIFWLVLLFLLGEFILNPAISPYFAESTWTAAWEIILPILTFLVGAIVYAYFRHRNSKMGIDVNKIYGEIPPE